LSANPTGLRPFASCCAATNASTGFAAQSASFTCGTVAFATGRNDQNAFASLPVVAFLRHRPGGGRPRVGGAGLHPPLEVGDLGVGQLLLRRHLHVVVVVPDGRDQQALVRVPRHDGRPGVAALEQGRPAVDQQPALGLVGLRAVALVAPLDEDRADPLLEQIQPVGGRQGSDGLRLVGGRRRFRGTGVRGREGGRCQAEGEREPAAKGRSSHGLLWTGRLLGGSPPRAAAPLMILTAAVAERWALGNASTLAILTPPGVEVFRF
jgi:hypothetical protein